MTDATRGMKGRGYYDEHSEYQREVAASGAALVEAGVDAIPLPGAGTSFTIADYGSATGANSVVATSAAVRAVRARDPQQPVAVVHNPERDRFDDWTLTIVLERKHA
jgi:hypothetical protein